MKRKRGRPHQTGAKVFERRLLAAMEFYRHYKRGGFGGTMKRNDALEHVATRYGFSPSAVRDHARHCKRAAVTWLGIGRRMGEMFPHDLRSNLALLPHVFDAFGRDLDDVPASRLIAAAARVQADAKAKGLRFPTYLRWPEARSRLLELIVQNGE